MPETVRENELPPELRDAVDEYDRDRNAEVLEDYEVLFDVLRQMHAQYPHWRFGQMITNLAGWSGKTREGNPYDVPDERLLETARRHLAERRSMKAPAGT
jgi:hypothetical protein